MNAIERAEYKAELKQRDRMKENEFLYSFLYDKIFNGGVIYHDRDNSVQEYSAGNDTSLSFIQRKKGRKVR
jgi:hypothetical protein